MSHLKCQRDFFDLTLERERLNLQRSTMNLMDSLNEFLLYCKDEELNKKIEREKQILTSCIISIYYSIDYSRKLLFPIEWKKEHEKEHEEEREKER